MTVKREDRRVQRTRALLLVALLELIVEKGYEGVTVQEIVDRANVGRSTFYGHFLDKRELLLSGVAELHSFLTQQHTVLAKADRLNPDVLWFSLPLFQHVQRHFPFCRALLSKQSGASGEQHVQRILTEFMHEDLAAWGPPRSTAASRPDVVVQYAVGAFMALLTWWVDQQVPYPPEEMDALFRQLTLPGMTAAVGSSPPQRQS